MRKPSSTTGINKTSESPPPLRRDFIDYNREDEAKYASYNPHFRNTLDASNFQRNVGYRSSLQNMSNTGNDLSFNRNNRYRSTIQNGTMPHTRDGGRYIYSGSITPTPKSRYLTDVTPRMTPGSSMNSISTNPFDDDEDDNNTEAEIIVEGQVIQTQNKQVTSSSQKHGRRKKRRAPPPPIQMQNQAVVEGASQKEIIVELRINDQNGLEQKNGFDELSRLTAEFESFVKNSDIQSEPIIIITSDVTSEKIKSEESKSSNEIQNGNHEKGAEIIVENKSSVLEDEKTVENSKAIVSERDEKDKSTESIEIVNEDLRIKEVELQIKEARAESERLKIKKSAESEREQSPEIIQAIEVHQLKTETRSYPEIQRLTPTPTPSREETPDFIPLTVREKFHVLRIEENEDDYLKPHASQNQIKTQKIKEKNKKEIPEEIRINEKKENSENTTQLPVTKIVEEKISSPKIINQFAAKESSSLPSRTRSEEMTIESSPIRVETRIVRDRTPIPLARTEIEYKLNSQGFVKTEWPKKSDEAERYLLRQKDLDSENNVVLRNKQSGINNIEDEGEPPKVPERRRSVKEIIESINRQQQKLKINQPPSPQVERKYHYGDQRFSYTEKPALPSKENVLLKLQRQVEHERRINELLDDLQDFNNVNHNNYQRTQKFPVFLRDTNNNQHKINPIPKPRRNV